MNSECTNPTCHDAGNEAEWQALRYTLGEMTPAEIEEFESRLADDQQLRELLATSVELVAAVNIVEEESATVVAAVPPRPNRLLWPLATVSACAVVALAAFWLTGSVVRLPGEDVASNNLPAIWSQQLTDANEAGDDGEPAFTDQAELPLAVAEGGISENSSDEFDVPGWMIAALSLDDVRNNGPATMEN